MINKPWWQPTIYRVSALLFALIISIGAIFFFPMKGENRSEPITAKIKKEDSLPATGYPPLVQASICDILANPDFYNHKVVYTTATLSIGNDVNALMATDCAESRGWLRPQFNSSEMAEKLFETLDWPRPKLYILGQFEKEYGEKKEPSIIIFDVNRATTIKNSKKTPSKTR